MSDLLRKRKSGINPDDFKQALAEGTKCGCGLECECYGYVALPNWVSATGERQEGYVIYIVNGAVKVATKAAAEAEIKAYKAL